MTKLPDTPAPDEFKLKSPLILFAISIFIKGILIAIEVKLFFRIQYIVQYIGFISFIACPILAYRLLVISGLIS